jgi:fatty-acid peroxygenase
VRRYYPFLPLVAGRALQDFDWRSHRFKKGTWVLLDIYGTNHDPRWWKDPDAFNPDRFAGCAESAYTLIPQGGGSPDIGHRCAGEWITVELVKAAVYLLVHDMQYNVPQQNLTIDMSRMPALPRSRFVISNIRSLADAK